MITVMGASGHTGSAVADALLAAGERIRVVGRSAERLQPFAARGAEPAVGDVHDRDFLAEAFRGAEAAYAMVPPNYADPDQMGLYERTGAEIALAVKTSGMRRLVILSSLGADLPEGTGSVRGLHLVEERLKKELMNADMAFLRAAYFFENHLATLELIRTQGINGGAIPADRPFDMIAAADVGAIAADTLRRGRFSGPAVLELTGPRELGMREVTRIIGERLGRPDLPYVRFPDADYVRGLVAQGFPEPVARGLLELGEAIESRRIAPRGGEHMRRRGGTTFEEFAERVMMPAYRRA
jgi:uncharacterized protein YbjT (DUF2867 family)